jgi:hypothetical protein
MPDTSFRGADLGVAPAPAEVPVVADAPAAAVDPVPAALAIEPMPMIDNTDKDNFLSADLLSSVCMLKF